MSCVFAVGSFIRFVLWSNLFEDVGVLKKAALNLTVACCHCNMLTLL